MVQFRPAAVRGQFDPPVVEDISAGMSADMQRKISQLQQYNQEVDRIAQQEVEEAKRTTRNDAGLQMLAQFSKTAAAEVKRIGDQTAKDIEIGQNYANFFNNINPDPQQQVAEEVVDEAAGAQQDQVKRDALNFGKLYDSPALTQSYFDRKSGLGKGLAGERQLLKNSLAEWPGFLQSWRTNSNYAAAYRSKDPAAVAAANNAGLYAFVKSRNLELTTKKAFMEVFGPQAQAIAGNFANGILSQNIQQGAKDTMTAISGRVAMQANSWQPGEFQTNFQQEAQEANRLVPVYSQGQINKELAGALLESAVLSNDGDMLNEIGDIQIANQPGTELRYTYSKMFRQAEKAVEAGLDRKEREEAAQRALQGIALIRAEGLSVDERLDMTQDLYDELMSLGTEAGLKQAKSIYEQRKYLQYGFDSEETKDELLEEIENGGSFSDDFIDQTNMTDEDKKAVKTAQALPKLVEGSSVKAEVESLQKQFKDDLYSRAGQRDSKTGEFIVPRNGAVLNKGQVDGLVELFDQDLETYARRLLQSTRGMDPAKQADLVRRELRQYVQGETTGKGKYAIDDVDASIKGDEDKVNKRGTGFATTTSPKGDEQLERLKRLVDPSVRPNTAINYSYSQGNDADDPFKQQMFWNNPAVQLSQALPMDVQARYNQTTNYDQLIAPAQFTQIYAQAVEQGSIPSGMARWAQQLGLTEKQLFERELKAHGKEPIEYKVPEGEMTPVQGARYLMTTHDVPGRGAAWLSGNIKQESSWIANRTAWNDVGAPAGGLVSWRAERLAAIESFYGRKIENITTKEQLDYMIVELRSGAYPTAERVFLDTTNPTERDLILASKEFWNWDDRPGPNDATGQRFEFAEQIENKLNER